MCSGVMILSKELLHSNAPMKQMMNEMMSADTYSKRAYPKGCSLSAGLLETLNPKRVMPDEIASDKTLIASDINAIEPLIKPMANVATQSSVFEMIP